MPRRETASEIDEAAANWAARAERGLEAAERAALDQWLDGDSRHLGAFVRAQAAWIHAERAAALGKMPEQDGGSAPQSREQEPQAEHRRAARLSRRTVLGGGGAVAAAFGAAYLLGPGRYRTLESGIGEIRHLSLAGGTRLTLDTDSRVDVALSSEERRLQLVRGKLFLDVAPRRDLPFALRVGGIMIETLGASFGVESLGAAPLVALVTAGTLFVSQAQTLLGRPRTLTLGEGHALVLNPGERLAAAEVRPVQPAEREQRLAWRDGMLSFGGEALGAAVRAFDRYGSTRIAVDPDLAGQRVTGLFKATDPKGFAMAVAASFGAVVRDEGEVVRLSAKKPAMT